MKKSIPVNKHYYRSGNKLYMVCQMLSPNSKYLWRIFYLYYTAWHEYAIDGEYTENQKESWDRAMKIFHEYAPDAVEVAYTEGNLCIAGDFKNEAIMKEEILDVLREKYPNMIFYFN